MKKKMIPGISKCLLISISFLTLAGNSSAITPNRGWADSYSANGKCYCATTYDHGIGEYMVNTPVGSKKVREICQKIGAGPGKGNNPVYNTVQCGHEPGHDDAIRIDGQLVKDEKVCPGRVDIGSGGCSTKGPTWDLSVFGGDLSSAPAPALPELVAPSGFKWEVVDALSDNFNGNQLNSQKWLDYHIGWSGRAPSKFKKENVSVNDGFLYLRSTSRINNMSEVSKPFQDIWVDAAVVASKQKIAQPGWYYETSMKASDTGMSSSFWFRMGRFSEIDVIEHIGRATKGNVDNNKSFLYEANTHVYGTQSGKSIANSYKMSTRGRDEFHRYGLWWKDANNLWFYHNGVKVFEINPSVAFTEKLNMIFDTETLASKWVGLPTIASLKDNSRNAMLVDWVRTWKLVPGEPSPNPEQKIPGKIEAEAFSNQNGIKVENTSDSGGGKNVGYVNNGDSLEFQVGVAQAGNYSFDLRVASATSGGTISLNSNGSSIVSAQVPNTGGWQNWKTISVDASLASGNQTLSLKFSGGSGYLFNLNWFEAELIGSSGGGAFKTHSIPGKIEVEDYDKDGLGVSYFDINTGNSGGQYRQDSVDVGKVSDIGGGHFVGWINSGEWLEYTVSNIAAGTYDINLRVAAAGNSEKQLRLQLDGSPLGTLNFNATDGWQNWRTQTIPGVFLAGGDDQKLRLNMDSSSFNVNWIEFVPTNSTGGDQCDTTAECKSLFGNQATDCLNSWSDNSICMCGPSQCQ